MFFTLPPPPPPPTFGSACASAAVWKGRPGHYETEIKECFALLQN